MKIAPLPADAAEPVIYLDGSTEPKVYDFANGPDEPPEPQIVDLPTWPGYLAHVRWPHDGAVLLMPEVHRPEDAVDLRCGSCTAAPVITFDQQNKVLIFMINHQRGCQAVADLMAIAGA